MTMERIAERIRACALDMDGTLLDSFPWWRRVERSFCAERGFERPDDGRMLSLCDMRAVSESSGLSPEEVWQTLQLRMYAHYQHDALAKPGAAAFVSALRGLGVRCCLATASRGDSAQNAMARCGLLPLFDRVVSTHYGALRKENPAFFRQLAAEMGVETKALLVVEDELANAKSAKAAGCTVIGVLEPTHRAETEMRAVCDAFAGTPGGLIRFL